MWKIAKKEKTQNKTKKQTKTTSYIQGRKLEKRVKHKEKTQLMQKPIIHRQLLLTLCNIMPIFILCPIVAPKGNKMNYMSVSTTW